jgi:hypothetical protein
MNALLGVEVPNTTGINQTTIIQGYIDPPTELVRYSDKLTPIGSANDGTQIWKVTHNGVDTHAIHFHMYNVQIINRVGWDGAIRGPDPNEIGWKDTVRMHPLEDAIIALRPIAIQNLPFKIPNSIRALDVTMPLGTTTQFEGVNPLGNPVTVTNTLLNFGCEYVWHCHLLGHEENDMMRAQALAVPPEAPTNLVATLEPSNAVLLTWTDNSINATGFTVQRATDSSFITGLATFNLGKVSSFLDNTLTSNLLPFYYRVFANNIVGSTVVGTTVTGLPAATGYPTLTVNSLTNRVTNIANLVVRGTNNILYYRTYNSSTNTWNNWTALPAGSTMDEPAATVAGGAIHVVVRGMDGNSLYYGNINQATSTFSGWTPLSPMAGGSTPSAPTLTSNDTSLILVVRGPNNLVNYRFYDLATQAWTDWIALPSQTTSGGPAAAILGKMLHIVVKDLAGISLFYGSVDLGTNLFSGWMPITGFTPSDPTLTSNGTTLALVVRGGDNAVYYRFYNPVTQTWTSWSSLPTGTTIEGPAGATILGNKLHIVVRGNDGNSLWHSNLDISSTVFSGWTYLTGSTPSKPTLAS